MSSARQAVDSRTAQRLRARRVVVVDAVRDRGEAFARALQQGGANAVAVAPDQTSYAHAHALDADAMLVNEDEAEQCRPLVLALRRHPRTRWATVLPNSFAALWPHDAAAPDIAVIAAEVSRHAETSMELSVRAKGKLPYEAAIEPLGPNRVLRVLDNTERRLRVVLSNERLHAELELGEHRVSKVRAAIDGGAQVLVDVEALAEILALTCGRVRIEESSGAPARASWNASLAAALEAGAGLAWARATSDDEPVAPAASGVRPAVSERIVALGYTADGEEAVEYHATVPAIVLDEVLNDGGELDPYAQTAAEVHAYDVEPEESAALRPSARPTVEVTAAPSIRPLHAIAAGPSLEIDVDAVLAPPASSLMGPRARRRTGVFVVVLALAGGLAMLLHASPLPWQRAAPRGAAASDDRSHGQPGSQPSASAGTEGGAATAVATQAASAAEPTAQAPARAPNARELKQARSITLRGHRYLRADRHETAAMAYLKALAIAPDYEPAIAPLVRIYLDKANAPEALRWAERLATLAANDGDAQLLLGDAHELNGDAARATAAWQRASTLGNAAARKRLAQP